MLQIARKSLLTKNLKRLGKLFPENYSFYPRTWCLPVELSELKLAQTQSGGRLPSIKHSPGFAMIVKPDHMSQGKGIFLTGDVDKIDTSQLCVAQEYLNTPYLLNGVKFDMRIYVLVLSCDPLRIYIHKEGLVRFCTQAYVPVDVSNPKTMESLFMHLTNYALNKENEAFLQPLSVSDTNAHKRTLTSVYAQLQQLGVDVQSVQRETEAIVIKTLLTVQKDLAHSYRASQPSDQEQRMCFQLLGFDIILDQNARPLLLEVNHAPSFATDSVLDLEVKRSLFVDMFTLLDLTRERKLRKLQATFEDKLQRLYAKPGKDQRQERHRTLLGQLSDQDTALEKRVAGFVRVYPVPIERLEAAVAADPSDTELQASLAKALAAKVFYADVIRAS